MCLQFVGAAAGGWVEEVARMQSGTVPRIASGLRDQSIFYGLPSLAATLLAVASDVKNSSRLFF